MAAVIQATPVAISSPMAGWSDPWISKKVEDYGVSDLSSRHGFWIFAKSTDRTPSEWLRSRILNQDTSI